MNCPACKKRCYSRSVVEAGHCETWCENPACRFNERGEGETLEDAEADLLNKYDAEQAAKEIVENLGPSTIMDRWPPLGKI